VLSCRAPSLKSLHLIRSYRLSEKVFLKAIKKLPLLEELELSLCAYNSKVLELVAQECPRLKHFRHVWNSYIVNRSNCKDDKVAFAIAKMHGLRSLHLIADYITNTGLTAIIDNCPRLEYLNIRDCPRVRMDDNLAKKCACIIMDDCEYSLPPSPGGRFCFSPRNVPDTDTEGDYYDDNEDDSSSASYCLPDVYDAERVFDNKSMLRYTIHLSK
jgi:hypothetical protein